MQSTIPATPWFYAVVLPETGQVLYNGQSEMAAAHALGRAGSWHGRGLSPAEARGKAWYAAGIAQLIRQHPAQGSSGTGGANGSAGTGMESGRQANEP